MLLKEYFILKILPITYCKLALINYAPKQTEIKNIVYALKAHVGISYSGNKTLNSLNTYK
jgi:hypothetical protein